MSAVGTDEQEEARVHLTARSHVNALLLRHAWISAGVAVLLVSGPVHAAESGTPPHGPPATSSVDPNLPPAAKQPPPDLPQPDGWPFADSFPKTSGVNRLDGGAVFWSDFLYDDYGATGAPAQKNPVTARAPSGSYGYADTAAYNNGADIFRTAVGVDGGMSYWRIDWNTLADAEIPVGLFALENVDGSAASTAWPANANVAGGSPDAFLLVSGTGAWLIGDEVTPVAAIGGSHHVDMASRSFVVSIPEAATPTTGTTRIRLVSGLANDAGDGFRQLGLLEGALPGQPNVYNVGFRSYDVEPPLDNPWMEAGQAEQLTAGDVSPFFLDVNWDQLRADVTTPEPAPTGFSNRWYVSSLELGHGYTTNGNSDVEPVFLGRVQPYSVYVPDEYDGEPTPLTWLMHSALTNHNQWYRANMLAEDGGIPMYDQLCRDRRSICVSPFGRSPWGWWMNEAELDVFEVWREVLDAYAVDHDRVTMAGMSLGGWGAYRFGLTYPDLFSSMFVLAGPPACADIGTGAGASISTPTVNDPERRCVPEIVGAESSGHMGPLVPNARWLPYAIVHDPADPLVPVPSVIEHVGRFEQNGLRYRYATFPPRGHAGWAYDIDFSFGTTFLDRFVREKNPPAIDYRWYPNNVVGDLGIGPHAAWWLTDLEATPGFTPGSISRVSARPGSWQQPPPQHADSTESTELGPIVVEEQTWLQEPQRPSRVADLHLTLENVAGLTVGLREAGLRPHETSTTITVVSDSNTRIALPVDAPISIRSDRGKIGGTAKRPAVAIPDGRTILTLGPLQSSSRPARTGPAPAPGDAGPPAPADASDPASQPGSPLPATGGDAGWLSLALLGGALLLTGRTGRPHTRSDSQGWA